MKLYVKGMPPAWGQRQLKPKEKEDVWHYDTNREDRRRFTRVVFKKKRPRKTQASLYTTIAYYCEPLVLTEEDLSMGNIPFERMITGEVCTRHARPKLHFEPAV